MFHHLTKTSTPDVFVFLHFNRKFSQEVTEETTQEIVETEQVDFREVLKKVSAENKVWKVLLNRTSSKNCFAEASILFIPPE